MIQIYSIPFKTLNLLKKLLMKNFAIYMTGLVQINLVLI